LNHSSLHRITLLLATVAATPVLAEEGSAPRWGLGAGVIASDNPYAGRGTRYTPFPLITYDSERFFFEGITAGVHLYDDGLLRLDFIAEGNFDGIDADDFGRRELAVNGIDRDLLEDRDDSVDVGFDARLQGRFGEFSLKFVADALDASGGYQATAEYGYPIEFGERLTVTPNIGVKWLSADSADYYYGTLDEEVARGVVNYRPGSAAIPEVGLDVQYNFAGKWLLLGSVAYESLPSKIGDSPLLESDSSTRLMIGVLRAF
jgi:outer membrane protein